MAILRNLIIKKNINVGGRIHYYTDCLYPVNSIYISTTNTNPGTLLGGTWEAFSQGRVLMGVGTGTDDNEVSMTIAANTQGGSINIPDHIHSITATTSESEEDEVSGYMGVQDCAAITSSSNDLNTGDASTTSGGASSTYSSTELPGDANSQGEIFSSQNGGHASSRVWYTLHDGHQFKTSGTSSNAWMKMRFAMGHSHSANHGHSYNHNHGCSHSHTSTHTHDAPAHTHSFAHTHTFTGTTGSTGTGTSGNLQPSLAVYMWKRTA